MTVNCNQVHYIVLAFYRKDHLRKHLQTHSKVFLEQNSELVGEHGLVEIKQEILDEYSTPNENEEHLDPMQPNNYEVSSHPF